MSHGELKLLETSRKKVKISLQNKKQDQVYLSREINQILKTIRNIDSRIESLKVKEIKNDSITVTEHAILRYLERVKGIDIEEVKKEIVSAKTLAQINTLGAGYYPCVYKGEEGDCAYQVRVKDNAVVTVLTN